jgi:hypothetical protein
MGEGHTSSSGRSLDGILEDDLLSGMKHKGSSGRSLLGTLEDDLLPLRDALAQDCLGILQKPFSS